MNRPFPLASFLLTIMLSTAACSEGDEGSKRVTQMRCESDGLCAQRVGINSLELGYRRGDRELRMDVIYRRYGRQMVSNRPYSVRIIDPRGAVFVNMGSGSDPKGWSSESLVPLLEDGEVTGVEERNEMCHQMLEAMGAWTDSSYTAEDAWLEATEQLRDFVASATRPADEVTQTRYFSLDLESDARENFSQDYGYTEPELVDEEEAVHGTSKEEDPQDDDATKFEHSASSLQKFGHFSGLRKRNIDYAEHYKFDRFEFTQEIDLWNQNTKSFLFGGWKTRKHHSAAFIKVLYRHRDSNETWRVCATQFTKNHGSRAGEGAMRQYAACRSFPVTKGYFNWKGECDGLWATGHLCNDDTAYQVWHAYGGWNGGRHCIGKKRGKRPSCDKPW